jgi:anthranilate/para-aminobenzoate synthase component I
VTPPEKKFSGGVLLYMPVTAESKAAITVTPVVHTMPADLLTPLAVYLKLSENSSHSFLLESVQGGRNLTRYSFIGADPEMIIRGNDQRIEVIDKTPGRSVQETGLIDFLKSIFLYISPTTIRNCRHLSAERSAI